MQFAAVHESVYGPSQIVRWNLMSAFGELRTSREADTKRTHLRHDTARCAASHSTFDRCATIGLELGAKMKRREFIALIGGAATAWPLAAHAQQSAMPVIGFLSASDEDSIRQYSLPAFHQGLRQAGFVEKRNVMIEYRWANGEYAKLPAMAADLVSRQVAVITTTGGTASALAAKAATGSIPIVFNIGSDPVKDGLVVSLNHPGGNITGVILLAGALEPKRLELLREIISRDAVIAFLVNPNFSDAKTQLRDVQAAAGVMGQRLVVINASTEQDFDPAFQRMIDQRIGGLLVSADPFFTASRDQLMLRTTRYAIPTMFAWREFAAIGGLMSYGTSLSEAYRLVGIYTGQVLKGVKTTDLPVQQSVKVELVINLKAAKALGITFPTSLLVRADEVIE
jgi:putative tryptophan/tyrosine transport system substrate-binding protein